MELAAAIHILQRSAADGRPAQSHSVDDRSRDGYDLACWHRQCFWHLCIVCRKSLLFNVLTVAAHKPGQVDVEVAAAIHILQRSAADGPAEEFAVVVDKPM